MKDLSLLFIVVLFSCSSGPQKELPFYHSPDFTATWDQGSVLKPHYISSYSFINHENKEFGTEELKGKIHVMNCFFTACPSLCPTLMGNLKSVQKQFSNDPSVTFISLSVTPERDTVPRLKEYALAQNIGANWHLLTGSKSSIYETARKSYFVDENIGTELGENDFLHTENVILVDQNLQIRGIYNGSLPLEMELLVKDIQELKANLKVN